MLCDKDNYSKKIAWHLENADFEIPSTITEDIETLKNKTYSLEVDGYQSGTVNLELKDNNGTLTTIPFVEGYGIDFSSAER